MSTDLSVVTTQCDECGTAIYAWLDDVNRWVAEDEVPLCVDCNHE